MNIVKATRQFEQWLGSQTELVKQDVKLKHASMKDAMFPFLRATYYRWAQLWPEACPEQARSPRILAIGDLHIENFGTWRDVEGRLIWGVNDFDETSTLGYVNDLVRLAVSAFLGVESGHLAISEKEICEAITEGYVEAIDERGCPFVLGEQHTWLRQIAESELRDPVKFWEKLDSLPTIKQPPPASALEAMNHLMPERDVSCRVVRRVAGLGSLGHQRYVALATWRGGRIAREAKALVPSACHWAEGCRNNPEILYQTIISRAVRCPDPFVQLRGHWIVRRLSPHCSRIELSALHAPGAELRLLHAMGWETANIHLGTKGARKAILRHVKRQKGKWLQEAASTMLKAVRADWETWRKDGYS